MFSNSIQNIISLKEFHEQLVERYMIELQELPDGSLCCKRNKGKVYLYHYQYIQSPDGSGTAIEMQRYLSKEEDELKAALKRRRFIQESLPDLYAIIDAAKTFLRIYKPYNPQAVANSLPVAYADIPFCPVKIYKTPPNSKVRIQDIEEWKSKPFEKSEIFPENLKHGTSSGIKVRSKSECIIAELLEAKGIPFRYEAALKLNEKTYYPDFTILRPKDGKIVYWEHFGMTDDTGYNNTMMQKLVAYNRFGITLWDQLITTFEGKDVSIDVQHINKVIQLLIL
ncbi:MAG: hypothetical protein WC977_02135 [Anaerovoracaceae bacterium]